MSITFYEHSKTFRLDTRDSSYLMTISKYGDLLHLYYGDRIPDEDLSYLIELRDRGFSPNPHEAGNDRTFSLDFLPQEFSTSDSGDYRVESIGVRNADGSRIFAGKAAGHTIYSGKYKVPGMPSVRALEGEGTDTLEIRLKDAASGVSVVLYYGVFEEKNVITRAVRVVNEGEGPIRLEKLMSVTLDFKEANYDWITLDGRHMMERHPSRSAIRNGVQSVGSTRGSSSHQHNPFVILCEKTADEDRGRCYGCSFVYSGNFLAEAERDQYRQLRLNMGIHPTNFEFRLEPGEDFFSPEAVLAYSGNGLTGLSHIYHRLYRENLGTSPYRKLPRPVVINSWEAAYFDFDEEKLLNIARESLDMGVELFVLDDGWFGKRDDDCSGLGDWKVNRHKLKGGLSGLSEQIHEMGLKFGLWVEPEMVSEDSDLFREHPDWHLGIKGRPATRGRYQLVLDLSRKDVCDYIIDSLNRILDEARIEYIKWDLNRNITDVWSGQTDKERQGEVMHRYMLGLYRIMDEVILTHPDVLFCGCSGGGGRFDPAMLYYQPQIWCSDNTDAINRLKIQYGTSFVYPISSLEAHVSICPNHQTGRTVSLATRGIVASGGILGYELNSTVLDREEKELCRKQVEAYKENYALIADGDYYRLTSPFENHYVTAWQHVSANRTQALVSLVLTDTEGNDGQLYLKLKGLKKEAFYRINGDEERRYSGAVLMNAGLPIPGTLKQYEGIQFKLQQIMEGTL